METKSGLLEQLEQHKAEYERACKEHQEGLIALTVRLHSPPRTPLSAHALTFFTEKGPYEYGKYCSRLAAPPPTAWLGGKGSVDLVVAWSEFASASLPSLRFCIAGLGRP